MRPAFIPVGQIVNAHGIRGEVKVNPHGFDPEFLTKFDTIYTDGQPVRVRSARVHKSTVLMALPGVDDMDAALALKGNTVSIRRTDAHLPQGQYFDQELVGLRVIDCATGGEIGVIDRVLIYPAHRIYQVKGQREYLIPAVPGVFIESTDPDAGEMRVHLMKGLATDENICQEAGERVHTIYLSPCGRVFNQEIAKELKARYDHLILVCGHYEGVDQRFLDECVDEEISMGDFVLTGGEIPAMAVADCLCRMVPGVLPEESCYTDESHWNGLLEYPQYSRPEVWHGRAVPPVLLSGHHGNVDDWRKKESYKRTMVRRPDMFARFDETQLTTKHDRKVLQQAKDELRQEQEDQA